MDDINKVEMTGQVMSLKFNEGTTRFNKSYKKASFLLDVSKGTKSIKVSCTCWDFVAESVKMKLVDLDRVRIKGFLDINTWRDKSTNELKINQYVSVTQFDKIEPAEDDGDTYEEVRGKIIQEEPREVDYTREDIL